MKKHYKTDYFEKLCQIAKICNNNLLYSHKIITSQQFPDEKVFQKSKDATDKIKENLDKDYFTPFEREDIFAISRKLDMLNEYIYFICKFLCDNKIFSFSDILIQQISCLIEISDIIHGIFITLSETQKADLNLYISKAEKRHEKLMLNIYNSINNSEYLNYGTILHYIEKCAATSNEIIQLIQYTLLKNS